MFDLDKWQEILGTIKKNKLRTFLTAFSVSWGIFILIILLAAGQGLRNGVQKQFASDAKNYVSISGEQTSMAYNGYKPGRRIQLTNTDFKSLKDNLKGADNFSADYYNWSNQNTTYKNERASFPVRAVTPAQCVIENAKMIEGRFINENDIAEYRKVCSIGSPVKEVLFKNENPIGKFIEIGNTKYKVIGVFYDAGRGDNDRIYIPLVTAQRANNGKDFVNSLWFTTGDLSIDESENLIQLARKILAQKHHFNPLDLSAIGVYNNNAEYKRIMQMLDAIKIFVLVIGIFTLIAGVVGVSNIMMIIVKERTKEIGVRKALGASPWSIVSLIIQESIFITSIAGYIGLLFGVCIIEVIKYVDIESDFFKNPEVDLKIALLSVLLIVIAGGLAGLFPALKASRVEPITALREN
jgi:putative ABC transport system permease protein